MRILITGGLGQLGRALQRVLSDHELIIVDLPEVDLSNRQAITETVLTSQPKAVIHCAAYTDVDGCARNPEMAYRVNAQGTQNVALACSAIGADLVHISTNEVFAGDRPEGYEEWDRPNPINGIDICGPVLRRAGNASWRCSRMVRPAASSSAFA